MGFVKFLFFLFGGLTLLFASQAETRSVIEVCVIEDSLDRYEILEVNIAKEIVDRNFAVSGGFYSYIYVDENLEYIPTGRKKRRLQAIMSEVDMKINTENITGKSGSYHVLQMVDLSIFCLFTLFAGLAWFVCGIVLWRYQ